MFTFCLLSLRVTRSVERSSKYEFINEIIIASFCLMSAYNTNEDALYSILINKQLLAIRKYSLYVVTIGDYQLQKHHW